MIWFSSDWHFGHHKDFLYGPRGYQSSEEHDEDIISNHNLVVADSDDVYVLGDLMLEDNNNGIEKIKRMKGQLHIILGNHDTNVRQELYKTLPNVVEVCEAKTIKIGKQHYFLCHYPTITANYDDKPYHNHLINLFGHTHQKERFYDNNPFMYCVGLDAHKNFPASIEKINEDIHSKVQELYKQKQTFNTAAAIEKFAKVYSSAMEYFEKHPLGNGIL